MTTDQSRPCSQESMGADDSKSQASKGRKPEDYFHSTNFKQLYAYLITGLRNCSEETRDEFVDQLEDISLEDVDVEQECRNLENMGEE